MQRTREIEIGNEAPAPAEEAPVLDPAQCRADAGACAHGYCSSSRSRSRRSNAARSETTNKSASPSIAWWLAQVQCGIVNTSCCDQAKLCSPTVERPLPETTRQIMLQVT